MECEARLRGLHRIMYSKTMTRRGRATRAPRGVCYPHMGRFFRKTLRSSSRFGCPDAQTPPSPLVGEGGKGDEGQKRTGMQQTAWASGSPNSPFSHKGRRGLGGMRAKMHGNAANRASLPKTLPLRACVTPGANSVPTLNAPQPVLYYFPPDDIASRVSVDHMIAGRSDHGANGD